MLLGGGGAGGQRTDTEDVIHHSPLFGLSAARFEGVAGYVYVHISVLASN